MGRPRKNAVDLHICISPRLRAYLFCEAAERAVDVSQIVTEYIMTDIKDNGQVEVGEEGYVYRYRGPVAGSDDSTDDRATSATGGAVDDARHMGRRGLDGGSVRSEGVDPGVHRGDDDAAVARREDEMRREYGGHTRSLLKGRD